MLLALRSPTTQSTLCRYSMPLATTQELLQQRALQQQQVRECVRCSSGLWCMLMLCRIPCLSPHPGAAPAEGPATATGAVMRQLQQSVEVHVHVVQVLHASCHTQELLQQRALQQQQVR
jgi:hypothetical protein